MSCHLGEHQTTPQHKQAACCSPMQLSVLLGDLPRAAKKSVAKADVMICTPLPIWTHSRTAFLGGRKTSPETIFQPLSSISLPASDIYTDSVRQLHKGPQLKMSICRQRVHIVVGAIHSQVTWYWPAASLFPRLLSVDSLMSLKDKKYKLLRSWQRCMLQSYSSPASPSRPS